MTWKWPNVRKLIPEAVVGDAEIKHFTVTKANSKATALRALISSNPFAYVAPGRYIRLSVNGNTMMSDTYMEKSSNAEAISRAHGNVLVGGLGLGLVALAMCRKSEVKMVTVIENNRNVIDIVAPYIKHPKLEIVEKDIFEFKPNGVKYDIIWFDIWMNICTDNLEQIAKLHHTFKFKLNRANSRSWMSSWQVTYLRDMRRRGR